MFRKIMTFFLNFITSGIHFFKPYERDIAHTNLLYIHEETIFSKHITAYLVNQGYNLVLANTIQSAKNELSANQASIILLTERLFDDKAIDFMENNKPLFKDKFVIFITTNAALQNTFSYSALSKMIYELVVFN